jgi:hypothetical protein
MVNGFIRIDTTVKTENFSKAKDLLMVMDKNFLIFLILNLTNIKAYKNALAHKFYLLFNCFKLVI